jgi:hypothetical protein
MKNPFLKTPIGQHGRHIEIKDLKKSWSKWGDINLGVNNRTPEWNCQVCGEHQPEQIDPFLFPISNAEFLRICPKCENKKVKNNIMTFEILIMMCRNNVDNSINLT